MEKESAADISYDIGMEDYDPFEETEDDEDDYLEDAPIVISSPDAPEEKKPFVKPVLPPPERIDQLFAQMHPQRKVLYGILRFCYEQKNVSSVEEKTNHLKEHQKSVYEAADFTRLLSEAGALELVDETGQPYIEEENEPQIVTVDGVKYYETTEPKQRFWLTTPDGRAHCEKDDSESRMRDMLADDAIYYSVYQEIFDSCSRPEGASIVYLDNLLNHKDVMLPNRAANRTRRTASHFIKKMEDCDVLYWDGAWHLTPLAQKAIEVVNAGLKRASNKDSAEADAEQTTKSGNTSDADEQNATNDSSVAVIDEPTPQLEA